MCLSYLVSSISSPGSDWRRALGGSASLELEAEALRWASPRDEQGKGDAIYWAVYNLDQKNPKSQNEFEHLPPEQLLADIVKKDQRVAELMAEIATVLQKQGEP